MERSTYYKIAIVLGATALLSEGAFSKSVRKKILERDGYMCTICGSQEHLEVAHMNHDRTSPRYNHPSQGVTLCTEDHLQDHIDRAGENGLSDEANRWAIKKLQERIEKQKKRPSLFQLVSKIK